MKKIDGRKCLAKNCNNICNFRGHHIKSIGAGGTDDDFNIMPLCPDHHNMTALSIHKLGTISFIKRNPEAREYLVSKGWEECPITGKWFHQNFASRR